MVKRAMHGCCSREHSAAKLMENNGTDAPEKPDTEIKYKKYTCYVKVNILEKQRRREMCLSIRAKIKLFPLVDTKP